MREVELGIAAALVLLLLFWLGHSTATHACRGVLCRTFEIGDLILGAAVLATLLFLTWRVRRADPE